MTGLACSSRKARAWGTMSLGVLARRKVLSMPGKEIQYSPSWNSTVAM